MQQNALINGPVSRGVTVQVLQQPPAISQSSTVAQTSRSTPEAAQFTYKVKIINPRRKSDAIVRYLHYQSRFDSATNVRVKLIEEFKDLVPDKLSFNVGYFEGQQHNRIWLVSSEDFKTMYTRYPKGDITLWCDSREEEDSGGRKKRKKEVDSTTSRRQEKEEELELIVKDLMKRHGEKWDIPKYRLWARMNCNSLHDDLDKPPDIPAFRNSATVNSKQNSLTSALTGAAVAIVNACSSGKQVEPGNTHLQGTPTSLPTGISPSKVVDE